MLDKNSKSKLVAKIELSKKKLLNNIFFVPIIFEVKRKALENLNITPKCYPCSFPIKRNRIH